jgi:hypothetical protein
MRDVTDLFLDLKNGSLPAVSYVKPDGTMDGHPASSKWTLFEAFAKNIIELAQSNPDQWAETAIFVTVDEGGRILRFGIHPTGGLLRDGTSHSYDCRIALFDRRACQSYVQRTFLVREIHRTELEASRYAERAQPGQLAQSHTG